ncbi:hypothetical protein [Conexibacter arvalis]|uniref:Flp pilus assembly protein TadB n=1 Tax=Conexibacter arvalis TaxID=912552 RepID=A0A840IC31_9ACTN|nr:hypothetical protein [Conexibacter arvalis]MBB4662272.1 Flp pilus assembly protein TadB [Conexibacter arvalis]
MAHAHRIHRPRRRLSRETERQLTAELREAVGRDDATLTPELIARARERHERGGSFVATLATNRLYIAISFFALVVIGGAIALATGSWWVLVGAVALHATGTLLTAGLALQLTTETEHVSPTVAARLEEEGVGDPDRVFTELVEEYAGEDPRERRARDVVESGANELSMLPQDDPARATAEQRTAMTPDARASVPAGEGSPIGAMPALVVAGTCVVALVAAIVEGGAIWVAAAIVWLAAIGWLLLDRAYDARGEERAGTSARDRGAGEVPARDDAPDRDRGAGEAPAPGDAARDRGAGEVPVRDDAARDRRAPGS